MTQTQPMTDRPLQYELIRKDAATEARLFKGGSGAGSNLSRIRGSREPLAGGGIASGPVSFMRGYDAFAGVIKSGGKTRRAAKMVILNADHPDIMEFIRCKATEEKKAWALIEAGYDGGFNVIDATIVRNAGRYVMILKDETRNPVKKNLRIAVSDKATGPYSASSPPFSPDWVEGPTAARIDNEWIVYFDMYRDKRYGAVKSADLKNWATVTDKLSMPAGARHGASVRRGRGRAHLGSWSRRTS